MDIRTRLGISADGYVATQDGWPPPVRDPQFVSGRSHGFPAFQERCEAVLMGRRTFEPALGADPWPWPDLDVFVLGRDVPTEGAPVPIVTDSDPARLLEKVRVSNRGRDVHLVGGPRTIETFRALGAHDKLGLLVLPFLLGEERCSRRLSTPTRGSCSRRPTHFQRAQSRSSTRVREASARREPFGHQWMCGRRGCSPPTRGRAL